LTSKSLYFCSLQIANHPVLGVKAGKFKLVPLHSSLSSEEQSAVFEKPRHGARKIVLSTNLAETSITIDDCVFVVDVGRMKEKSFDPTKRMESLETVWVTRANALQRKGAIVKMHLHKRRFVSENARDSCTCHINIWSVTTSRIESCGLYY